jgi:hypothetical protein
MLQNLTAKRKGRYVIALEQITFSLRKISEWVLTIGSLLELSLERYHPDRAADISCTVWQEIDDSVSNPRLEYNNKRRCRLNRTARAAAAHRLPTKGDSLTQGNNRHQRQEDRLSSFINNQSTTANCQRKNQSNNKIQKLSKPELKYHNKWIVDPICLDRHKLLETKIWSVTGNIYQKSKRQLQNRKNSMRNAFEGLRSSDLNQYKTKAKQLSLQQILTAILVTLSTDENSDLTKIGMSCKLVTTFGNFFDLLRPPNHGSGSNGQTTISCQEPRPLDQMLNELEDQLDHIVKDRFPPDMDVSGEVALGRALMYGKAYTSDDAGDGPNNKKRRRVPGVNLSYLIQDPTIQRIDIDQLQIGQEVHVQLETFSNLADYDIHVENPEGYSVVGQYTAMDISNPGSPQYQIAFDELFSVFWLGVDWVQAYGLFPLLRREVYSAPNPILRMQNRSIEQMSQIVQLNGLDEELKPKTVGLVSKLEGVAGILFLNINQLHCDHDSPLFHWLATTQNIGVQCLVDTRHTKATLSRLRKKWALVSPEGKIWGTTPTSKSRLGGAIFICDGHFSSRYRALYQDPSGLGLVQELSLWSQTGIIRIISVYWPIDQNQSTETSQQLINDLISWLLLNWHHQDPHLYMQEIIESRLRKPSGLTTIGGDWNSIPNSPRLQFLGDMGYIRVHEPEQGLSTHYSGCRPKRQIDHIFSRTSSTGYGYCISPILQCFSDHRPIWTYYSMGIGNTTHRPQLILPDYKMTNLSKVDPHQFNSYLKACFPTLPEDPGEWLKEFTDAAVMKLKVKLPKKQKQYWSPVLEAHHIWLTWIIKYEAKICRMGNLSKEDTEELEHKFAAKSDATREEWQVIKNSSALFAAQKVSKQEYQQIVATEFSNMHTKKRQESYAAIRSFDRELVQNNTLLYKYYGKPRIANQLSRIKRDQRIIEDPLEIHQHITTHFSETFAPPLNPLPQNLWEACQSFEGFQEVIREHQIPPSLAQIIHSATIHVGSNCQGAGIDPGSSAIIRQRLIDELSDLTDGPTLPDFLQTVKNAPKHRSGGPSGLTYDAIRILDNENLQLIYSKLRQLWKRGRFPPWMLKKHLCLIPKSPDDLLTADQFRPIMLIDTLRKLFLKPMVNKIRHVWERHGILSQNQYGFLSGRSCAHGVLQLVNAMENAHCTESSLYMSTYDIRKAFDSVQRTLSEMALIRLGVPAHVARTFAYIDEHDQILILSPYAKSQNNEAASFSSYIGTGQGDVHSPLIWTAVMDILLSAVKRHQRSNISFPIKDRKFAWVQDIAFADDYITMSRTLDGLQTKADIYSAACLTFGLSLAPTKFRAFAINPVKVRNELTIYGNRWSATHVKLDCKGAIKYLGSIQDMDYSGKSQRMQISQTITEIIHRLRNKMGQPAVILKYIKTCIIPKIQYQASFSPLALSTMQAWDTMVGTLMKARLHLPSSFPNDLLYAPGGLNLPTLSDAINSRKLELVYLLQRSDFHSRMAMEGILHRHTRSTSQHSNVLAMTNKPAWLNSLVESLQQQDICFHSKAITTHETEVRQGRMYVAIITTPLQVNAFEILGTSTSHIYFRKWDVINPPKSIRNINKTKISWTEETNKLTWCTARQQWTHKLTFVQQNPDTRYIVALQEIEPASISTTAPFRHTTKSFLHDCNASLPPSDQLIICSDGSWKSHPTGPFPHQTATNAAAAVVLFQRSPPQLLKSFRILGYGIRDHSRAYIQEYIGLVFATTLQREINSAIPIYSDSKAALASAKDTFLRQHPSRPLNTVVRQSDGKRYWVKAHADRQVPTYQLSETEKGNIAADKVASGEQTPDHCITRDQLDDIIKLASGWTLTKNGEVVLVKPASLFHIDRLQDYIIRKAGAWDLHLDINLLKLLASQPGSLRERAARLKLMFRKFDDDRIIGQEASARPRGTCPCSPTCSGVLDRWVHDCTLPEIIEKRSSTYQAISEKLAAYPTIREELKLLLRHPTSAALLWRGIWTIECVRTIETAATADHADFKTTQPILLQVSMILINAALSMRASRPYRNKTNAIKTSPQRRAFSNTAKQRRSQATASLFQFGFTINPG